MPSPKIEDMQRSESEWRNRKSSEFNSGNKKAGTINLKNTINKRKAGIAPLYLEKKLVLGPLVPGLSHKKTPSVNRYRVTSGIMPKLGGPPMV